MVRGRWLAAGVCLLLTGVLAGVAPWWSPDDGPDGALRPTASALEREVDRVLAEGRAPVSPDAAPATLVQRLVRCADLGTERYCLGIGFTRRTQAQVQRSVTGALTRAALRRGGAESTGDLDVLASLRRTAAMPTAERLAAEEEELTLAAASVDKASTVQAAQTKTHADYPQRSTVMRPGRTMEQRRTYWCGPATMQMIHWGWHQDRRGQKFWADRLGTTTSGTALAEVVRQINATTGWDRPRRAGTYIMLDVSDYTYSEWFLLQMRHVEDYRAPLVLHPILLKRYYPYLDDDASGHFQVGRGYDKRGDEPALVGYFEPWNQQRFDPSEPYIARVQWRSAYKSYRANLAHPHQNIGV